MRRGSAEIVIEAPVETIWNALIAPEPHRWYFRLAPKGKFAERQTIRWVDGRGNALEESEIVELERPRRLLMDTRFLFAPTFAQQAPHRVTWEIQPEGTGCRARISWEANDLVAAMLEADAEGILEGLRLEHDASAQAEIARLTRIGTIEVHDVTPDRVSDYRAFFDRDAFRDFPAWRSCYCMETHRTQSDEEWFSRTAADNRRDMTELIQQRQVTALLAYVDGRPVGWCNCGETSRLAGVMRKFKLEAKDHEGVGSVACFVIAAPYRGHGVATRLLEAALDRLQRRGVKVVEAYPVKDTESPQSNYRGPLQMYLRAGFEPYRENGAIQIVRKVL